MPDHGCSLARTPCNSSGDMRVCSPAHRSFSTNNLVCLSTCLAIPFASLHDSLEEPCKRGGDTIIIWQEEGPQGERVRVGNRLYLGFAQGQRGIIISSS